MLEICLRCTQLLRFAASSDGFHHTKKRLCQRDLRTLQNLQGVYYGPGGDRKNYSGNHDYWVINETKYLPISYGKNKKLRNQPVMFIIIILHEMKIYEYVLNVWLPETNSSMNSSRNLTQTDQALRVINLPTLYSVPNLLEIFKVRGENVKEIFKNSSRRTTCSLRDWNTC